MKECTYQKILKLNIIPNLWCKANNDRLVVRFVTSYETKVSDIDEIIKRLEYLS